LQFLFQLIVSPELENPATQPIKTDNPKTDNPKMKNPATQPIKMDSLKMRKPEARLDHPFNLQR
jgi:hypothetical protein